MRALFHTYSLLNFKERINYLFPDFSQWCGSLVRRRLESNRRRLRAACAVCSAGGRCGGRCCRLRSRWPPCGGFDATAPARRSSAGTAIWSPCGWTGGRRSQRSRCLRRCRPRPGTWPGAFGSGPTVGCGSCRGARTRRSPSSGRAAELWWSRATGYPQPNLSRGEERWGSFGCGSSPSLIGLGGGNSGNSVVPWTGPANLS